MPGELCGAKRRGKTETCTRPAGWGTDHPGAGRCKYHGGCAPSGRIAAKRQLAARAAATFGLPVDIDPATALLEEVCRTAGHVRWLARVVAELDPAAVTFGVSEIKQGGGPTGDYRTASAAPNVWVQLYQSERKHLVDVCRATLAAGVEERRVRLAEQQGELLAGVIRGILTDLGVLDRPGTAEVVRRHLMTVAAIDTTADATTGA